MKDKKIIIASIAILPLLLACSSVLETNEAIERIDNIVATLDSPDYKVPTRFQLIYETKKDYIKSENYKNETHVFVCDNEGYKIFSQLTTDSNIDGTKTKKTDTMYNWIDSNWTFHSAFENETKKSHSSQEMNKDAAIVMFNKFATTVMNPALMTKALLKSTSAYLKQDKVDNYEFSFKSSGASNITIDRTTTKFEDNDIRSKHVINVQIKNNVIAKGYQIQVDKEIAETIEFTFTIGNVWVNLPDLSTY